MLVHGDADKGYHNSIEAYPALHAPKWFVTLHGSLHSPPFEVPRGSEAPLVDAVTTIFWDHALSGNAAAGHAIAAAVSASGRARLAVDLETHH